MPRAHADRRGNVEAGRSADEESFLVQQPVYHRHGLGIVRLTSVIQGCAIEVGPDAAVADPLGNGAFPQDLRLSSRDVVVKRTAPSDRLARIAPGESSPSGRMRPRPGSCRSGGGDECVDSPVALTPSLGPGGRVMGQAVIGVIELTGPECVFVPFGKAPGLVIVVRWVGAGRRGHLMHLRSEGSQKGLLLLRLALGDKNDAVVSAGIADMGEAGAGIARRPFDDGPARLELTALLGLAYNRPSCPALDRPAGIQELRLTEDLISALRREARQGDQRRVADSPTESVDSIHHLTVDLLVLRW